MGKWEDFQQGFTGMSAEELKESKKKRKKGFLEKLFTREVPEDEKKDKKKSRYSRTKSMLKRSK